MATMQFEVFEAFRSLGVAEDKASAAAQALAQRDPDITTLKSDLAALKGDVNAIKIDVAVLKWGMAIVVAGVISLVLKAFVH